MLFNSLEFIFLFLPCVLVIFHLARFLDYQFAKVCLIICSLYFYGYWNYIYLVLIISSVLFNYLIAGGIQSARGGHYHKIATLLLTIGVSTDLILIGYFKYSNFFVDSINSAFGSSFLLETVILPLAISFFTFQQITFLVDTKRGEIESTKFIDYALFVTFFPQLIAGPIVHIKDIVPQFVRNRNKGKYATDIAVGLAIFSVGLFKKTVIADTAENYVLVPFGASAAGADLSTIEAWGTACAFGVQIYFDFSGYSDMAIGLARMFGIRLPQNFASPYKSKNIIEFWRCWHMTLSQFLRDYVYFTMGGNRKGRVRRHINLAMTMLLGGLWHGAGWNFVIWGGLHGFYLIVNHGWRALLPKALHDRLSRNIAAGLTSQILTLLAVIVAWVFFRAETLASGISIVGSMLPSIPISEPSIWSVGFLSFDFSQLLQATQYWEGTKQLIFLAGAGVICLGLPNTQQLFARFRPVVDAKFPVAANFVNTWRRGGLKRSPYLFLSIFQWRLNLSSLLIYATVALVGLVFLFGGKSGEFIYFQF